MSFEIRQASRQAVCSVASCHEPRYCKGFCKMHYARWKKHGNTDKVAPYGRVGEKNPNWKGGKHKDRNRVMLAAPDHPFKNRHGYVYRYRLVLEKQLGRYLRADEVVHHINGDCSDDRPENLEALTAQEHTRRHAILQIPYGKWSMKHDACVHCAGVNNKHKARGMCEPCYEKVFRAPRRRAA